MYSKIHRFIFYQNKKYINYQWPRLRYKHIHFTPSALITILTLLLILIFIRLGLWQWQRSELNAAIVNAYNRQATRPLQLLPLNPTKLTASSRFARITTTGFFLNQHSYLLDNAVFNHHVGYRVLTVFLPHNNTTAILVDRGFIPMPVNRKQIPKIKTVNGLEKIEGMLDKPYQPAYKINLSKKNQSPSWLLQQINISHLSHSIQRPIYPFILVGTNINSHIYYLQQLPKPPNKILMHQGYAMQWFTFAITLFIIYLTVNLKKLASKK